MSSVLSLMCSSDHSHRANREPKGRDHDHACDSRYPRHSEISGISQFDARACLPNFARSLREKLFGTSRRTRSENAQRLQHVVERLGEAYGKQTGQYDQSQFTRSVSVGTERGIDSAGEKLPVHSTISGNSQQEIPFPSCAGQTLLSQKRNEPRSHWGFGLLPVPRTFDGDSANPQNLHREAGDSFDVGNARPLFDLAEHSNGFVVANDHCLWLEFWSEDLRPVRFEVVRHRFQLPKRHGINSIRCLQNFKTATHSDASNGAFLPAETQVEFSIRFSVSTVSADKLFADLQALETTVDSCWLVARLPFGRFSQNGKYPLRNRMSRRRSMGSRSLCTRSQRAELLRSDCQSVESDSEAQTAEIVSRNPQSRLTHSCLLYGNCSPLACCFGATGRGFFHALRTALL